METIKVTDDQIRAACQRYGLDPAGRVEVRYSGFGFESDDRADWDGDSCWEIVCSMADGEEYPEAGSLGFAAGHLSPGWQFLRGLCDRVAWNDIGTDWFEAMSYDEAREYLQDETDRVVAMLERPAQALVCVADLGVDEGTEDARAYLGDTDPALGGARAPRRTLLDLGEVLLGYAGYLVLREVFAPQIDSKKKE